MNQFVDDLNTAVKFVGNVPRVTFAPGLHPSSYKWLARKHCQNMKHKRGGGVHEPATIAAFLAIQNRFNCHTIFDLGALFGYFSLMCLDMFPDSEVTAFDMHGPAFGELMKNVPPHVKCVRAVVSDVSEKNVKIWISGFNIFLEPEKGWDYLCDVPGAQKYRGDGGAGYDRVDFLTLDDHCATSKDPDLIKIDVEAYQTKALLGAKELIKRARPIIVIELHDPPKVKRMGTTNQETVQLLFDEGYEGYWCGNHRSSEATFEKFDHISADQDKLSLAVFIP